MMHDWWGWNGGWGGGMLFGPLFMLLIFVLVVAGIVAIVRWIGASNAPQRSNANTSQAARDILDQRFAKGEVDADEYNARRRALEN